ncbi:chorismate synthase [Candidatus Desantisbacteria bacterium]|nr:chorismate synthase [Candidatus Desantisbacteria bacterium]
MVSRMNIENDTVEITSGVRFGRTIGSPISMVIKNKDWENWQKIMSVDENELMIDPSLRITRPRPGHADLPGIFKYHENDIRNILERASARETAVRVAAGALCKCLLKEFNINILSHVVNIGGIQASAADFKFEIISKKITMSELRCADKNAEKKMKKIIDKAKSEGDSIGGIFEILVQNIPVGLGSHVHYKRKLDAAIASALMSIQAIKGIEFGLGFKMASLPGSKVHDEIFFNSKKKDSLKFGFYRKTNNAGGIEGGMSNGEIIVIRAVMKPIPTLYKPLRSVDINSKKPFKASIERSDICAVPAASIVGEAVTAIEITDFFLDKFRADSLVELKDNYENYNNLYKGFSLE